MAAIITETQSIKEAVTSINTIELNKFSRLLSRILQKLHLKEERTFSEEEEQKLQSALSLDKQNLSLVLDTTAFILEQAVYHNVKPASLKQQLEKIHLSPEKAEAFCQVWTAVCPDVVEKVRQRIFAPKKLEHVGWQLNLQMGTSTRAKLKDPHAVLELGVRNEDSEILRPVCPSRLALATCSSSDPLAPGHLQGYARVWWRKCLWSSATRSYFTSTTS
ncbi:COMM domain-containing protein 10 isoform X1 [Salvelinus fontinalis]|uniref:COMM domain-containing protein 10 isoform X1 n=1 Tax=Salvelinus fontinalis TaxID=8038 RepID=UPI0024851519|nr:COMM domain-containing protein 10 isoform X1 [Salvelinus fontinalis]